MEDSRPDPRDTSAPADFEDLTELPRGELIKIIRKQVNANLVKSRPGYLKRFRGMVKRWLKRG